MKKTEWHCWQRWQSRWGKEKSLQTEALKWKERITEYKSLTDTTCYKTKFPMNRLQLVIIHPKLNQTVLYKAQVSILFVHKCLTIFYSALLIRLSKLAQPQVYTILKSDAIHAHQIPQHESTNNSQIIFAKSVLEIKNRCYFRHVSKVRWRRSVSHCNTGSIQKTWRRVYISQNLVYKISR